jgi:hypothetical protein
VRSEVSVPPPPLVGQALLIIVNFPVLPEICNVTDVVSLEKEMVVPLQVPDTHVQVPSSPVDSTEVVPPAAEMPSMPPASMMPMLPPVPPVPMTTLPPVPTIPTAPPVPMTTLPPVPTIPTAPPVPMTTLPPAPPTPESTTLPPVPLVPPVPALSPTPVKTTVRGHTSGRMEVMLSVAVAGPTVFGAKVTQTLHESGVKQ